MSIDITIAACGKLRKDYKFVWEATSAEAAELYEYCEDTAASKGLDPKELAAILVGHLASKGVPDRPDQEQGQRVWAVYLVLKATAERVDFEKMVDLTGNITDPPTVFDLAEYQQIVARVQMRDHNRIAIELSGHSILDS